MFAAAAPVLFVLVWSTGFLVARGVLPYVDPQFFLAVRLALVALILGGAAVVARERWPRGRRLGLHMLAGAMLPGTYMCGGWWAVQHGMPAGIMSLLGSLQPLFIAFLSFVLRGERLGARSWAGLAVGVTGVVLVLAPAVEHGVGGIPVSAAIVALLAVLSVAGSTMIQHAFLAADPLRSAGAVQNFAGTLVAIVATAVVGGVWWHGSAALWIGLSWSVLALSAGALPLLSWMLRHQGATRVSTLFLLVPALAAVEAWLLFGERLGPVQVIGFATALGGVVLARSRPRIPAIEPA